MRLADWKGSWGKGRLDTPAATPRRIPRGLLFATGLPFAAPPPAEAAPVVSRVSDIPRLDERDLHPRAIDTEEEVSWQANTLAADPARGLPPGSSSISAGPASRTRSSANRSSTQRPASGKSGWAVRPRDVRVVIELERESPYPAASRSRARSGSSWTSDGEGEIPVPPPPARRFVGSCRAQPRSRRRWNRRESPLQPAPIRKPPCG